MFSLLQVIISTCKSLKGQGISRGFQNNLMYVSWKWKKKEEDLLVKEMPNHLLLGFGCTNARIIMDTGLSCSDDFQEVD